ncbi:hypothetical protein BC829DRAFT_181090 [Chytridium lagenaria]|nr:hypothetical protein BC829DRAFT_181090 [Chytridium lagenaria]
MSDGTGASQDPLHLALKEQIHQYYDVGRKMAESQQLQHRRTSLPAASMPMTATDMNNYSNINSSSNSNSMQALNSIAAAADLSSNIMHAGHVRRDSGGGVLRQGGGGSFDLQGGGQRGSAHAPSTPQFSPPGSYTINTALDVFNGMISPQLPLQQTTLSTTAGMGMDLLALPQLPPSAAPISEATSLHVLSEHQRIHLQQQQQQQQQQRDFAALVNAAAAANQQRTLSSSIANHQLCCKRLF